MKLEDFFPFTISEYLKVLSYFIIFFVILYLLTFLTGFMSFPSTINETIAAKYALTLVGMLFGILIVFFLIYTFLVALAYNTITKTSFRWMAWPRFMLSAFLMIMISLIPVLFSIRLLKDANPASNIIFIALLIVMFHFFNLVFLFTSLRERSIMGIREGFYFGTAKIKNLLLPYLFFIVVSTVFSLLMLLLDIQFLNLVLSGVFLSWAALYIGRLVISKSESRFI